MFNNLRFNLVILLLFCAFLFLLSIVLVNKYVLEAEDVSLYYHYVLKKGKEVPKENKSKARYPSDVVRKNGNLKVINGKLTNQFNRNIQLRGIATHGIQWFPTVKNETIPNLVKCFNIDVLRIPMYIEDYKNGDFWNGYISHPKERKSKTEEMIKECMDSGIYVIVSWHIHNNPNKFLKEASGFFGEISAKYGKTPNIIYEICNEPEYVEWPEVKSYAEKIIPIIRKNDPDNIIIVGTPCWCQDLDTVSRNPIQNQKNIMYALHFYAGSHDKVRVNAQKAYEKGLPIFVSEWGVTDYTGGSNSKVYIRKSLKWLKWMKDRNISWVNWNFSSKNEASSALLPGVSLTGPWDEQKLSTSGKFIKSILMTE